MKKLVLLSNGSSAHTYKWAKTLRDHFELYLISFNTISEDLRSLFHDAASEKRWHSFDMNIPSQGGNTNIVYKLPHIAKIVKQIQPHYIHAHYITSYGFVAAIIKKYYCHDAKLLLTAWGTDILVTPKKNTAYRCVTRFALDQADLITSDSLFMTDRIKELTANGKIITFPFGVDTFPDCSISDKDENVYFSNRALEQNYNINDIIRWFRKLHESDRKIRLIIANDGSEKENLRNLTKELGLTNQVDFVGYLNAVDQGRYYQKAKYYISIPSSDATSVSLLEAMSYGCTPIVSNIPSNREWIITGYNGIFFEDNLSADVLKKINAFDINRDIIKKKAIWENNSRFFIQAL